ncbi:MAG: flavodoxin [Clostridia bacterium]|nr:flavodoxin [Clostridia bacterium]
MNTVKIIYWSGTGNTEMMAEAIGKGARATGASVEVISVDQATQETVNASTHLILGCPSMGAEVLEESEFEPFIASTDFTGKKIALFGSYDWGDGEWMRNWGTLMEDEKSASLVAESLIVHLTPDAEALTTCEAFGKKVTEA